jgi:tetratricopeptide (TPR) repeat protein
VRKEVLSLQADPLSPERGQYGFLQDLMRRIAYEMLSKHERKAKHLAAAALDEDEDEVVEVVAAHYLAAHAVDPQAADADEIQRRACGALVRAGERAESLAANSEAERYYERAAALADESLERARLLERAGVAAHHAARSAEAIGHFEHSHQLFEQAGETHPAARVSARLGELIWDSGRLNEALERMDNALQLLSREEPDADVAALTAQVARFLAFSGDLELAGERTETALELAEQLNLPEVLSMAVNTKGLVLSNQGRPAEARALVGLALDVAIEHNLPSAAIRAFNNVADLEARADRFDKAAATYRDGLVLARRVGNRQAEWQFLGQLYPLFALGRWSEALAHAAQIPDEVFSTTRFPVMCMIGPAAAILANQGDVEAAARLVDRYAEVGASDDLTERASFEWARGALLSARGQHREALDLGAEMWKLRDVVGLTSEQMKETFRQVVEAALAVGDVDRAEGFVASVETMRPGRSSQSMRADALRLRARVSELAGDANRADQGFRQATSLFRELAMPFAMAVAALEHAEQLQAHGRAEEAGPLLEEARAVFERLEAAPWLQRASQHSGERATA